MFSLSLCIPAELSNSHSFQWPNCLAFFPFSSSSSFLKSSSFAFAVIFTVERAGKSSQFYGVCQQRSNWIKPPLRLQRPRSLQPLKDIHQHVLLAEMLHSPLIIYGWCIQTLRILGKCNPHQHSLSAFVAFTHAGSLPLLL